MSIVSKRTGTDERAALFPAELLPLFDDNFVLSWNLFEEYVARLALQVFRSTGLAEAFVHESSVQEALERSGLKRSIAQVPATWIVSMLASRGWIEVARGSNAHARYRLQREAPVLDPAEIARLQEVQDPRCLPSYRIAALAAEQYPHVLRGEMSGEEALFGPEGISAWVKYFSNDNPLYAISNAVGAIAAERALPADGGTILELGGGLGSGAQALLQRFAAVDRLSALTQYRFTEVSALFLKRAERTLRAAYPHRNFEFARLNIDRPFGEANVVAGSCALVYGVNVLHVARDLAQTLREIRSCLRPGGRLLISECVRSFAGMPLHLEIVFNLLASFREPLLAPPWRPNGGFLSTEQWAAAFEANGFEDVVCYPDLSSIRDAYPSFAVATIVGTRV